MWHVVLFLTTLLSAGLFDLGLVPPVKCSFYEDRVCVLLKLNTELTQKRGNS